MADHKLKYAVVEYTTNKNFCNVYDALGIERLEWEVVSYDRERRVHVDRANAYLPVTKAKLLVHHVLTGTAQQPDWKLEVFGGSVRDDGIESRLFKVEFDLGIDTKFRRFPWRLSIAIGPGKKTTTGGIAPNGKPTVSVSMRFPNDDFTGICLEIRDFLSAHQHRIEHVRFDEQHKQFTQRQATDSPAVHAEETGATIDPEDVVCHIGNTAKGKKLGKLSDEALRHITDVWQPQNDPRGIPLQMAAKAVLKRRVNRARP